MIGRKGDRSRWGIHVGVPCVHWDCRTLYHEFWIGQLGWEMKERSMPCSWSLTGYLQLCSQFNRIHPLDTTISWMQSWVASWCASDFGSRPLTWSSLQQFWVFHQNHLKRCTQYSERVDGPDWPAYLDLSRSFRTIYFQSRPPSFSDFD